MCVLEKEGRSEVMMTQENKLVERFGSVQKMPRPLVAWGLDGHPINGHI